jgi:hypothetical protein
MTRDETIVELTAKAMALRGRMDVELGELERVGQPFVALFR